MAYQIEDRQIHGRLFADGAVFDTEEEVRQQLLDYHSVDFIGEDMQPAPIPDMTLDEILEYGEWELVEQTA